MPKPTVTLQQQQLQHQRQMQHRNGDPFHERCPNLPERQDQPPRNTAPATQQSGSADQ